ncbi:MAG: PH domain-containing protein [Lutibacter sp.]|nr:PH domain-containing protein [Lutibacter sp.]
MDLREGERLLRVYRHHFTPYLSRLFQVLIGAFPFFFLVFIFRGSISEYAYVLSHMIVFFIFAMVTVYVTLVYWLDKLIITNKRIIFINWKYLTVRDESEALLEDIQDIHTHENGFLSNFNFLDYGSLKIDTASSRITILFENAPNPEGIRTYIYNVKGIL